jgi:uncharacterized protein (DUF433 family)
MSEESAVDIERIVQDPAILAGKPVVRGTRISVAVVLDCLAHNPDFGELFADYPRLTMDDVKACFAYARRLAELPTHDSRLRRRSQRSTAWAVRISVRRCAA